MGDARRAIIGAERRFPCFIGYLVGAAVMIFGGIVQATMGVEAAGRDLEDIAPPLSATEDELDEPGEEADPYTLGRGQSRQNQPAAPDPDSAHAGTPGPGPHVTQQEGDSR